AAAQAARRRRRSARSAARVPRPRGRAGGDPRRPPRRHRPHHRPPRRDLRRRVRLSPVLRGVRRRGVRQLHEGLQPAARPHPRRRAGGALPRLGGGEGAGARHRAAALPSRRAGGARSRARPTPGGGGRRPRARVGGSPDDPRDGERPRRRARRLRRVRFPPDAQLRRRAVAARRRAQRAVGARARAAAGALVPVDEIDVAVIGAGAVGLACAAVLAERGRSVVLLERHRRGGQERSSRNSGVIHAGLYYPTGSLKALLCVEGRRLLYARCARDGVPHRRCAKILVATDHDERRKIEGIHAQGLANGAGDLRLLDGAEVTRLEPRVRAVAGLLSPETGIVDVHGLMDSYRREAEGRGAILAPDNTVTALERRAGGWRVRARTSTEGDAELYARWVVNAAGLDASRVAALAGVDVRALGYEQRLCKGDYFRIAARHAGIAGRLIYPPPVHARPGRHLTFHLRRKPPPR